MMSDAALPSCPRAPARRPRARERRRRTARPRRSSSGCCRERHDPVDAADATSEVHLRSARDRRRHRLPQRELVGRPGPQRLAEPAVPERSRDGCGHRCGADARLDVERVRLQRLAGARELGADARRQPERDRPRARRAVAGDARGAPAVRGVPARDRRRRLPGRGRVHVLVPLHERQRQDVRGPDPRLAVQPLLGTRPRHEQRREPRADVRRRGRRLGVRDADGDRHPAVGRADRGAVGPVLGRLRLQRRVLVTS